MAEKIHVNFITEDAKIYCRNFNKVVDLSKHSLICDRCPFFGGTAGGEGIECVWDDDRETDAIHYVDNPHEEIKDITIHDLKKEREEGKEVEEEEEDVEEDNE